MIKKMALLTGTLVFLLYSAYLGGMASAGVITVDTIPLLNQAIAASRPGDVVVLKNGTYSGASVKFHAQGVKDLPIMVRAESPGGVILTGQYTYFEVKGSYLILSGIQFKDIDTTGNPGFRLMLLSQADHCRITDCTFVRVGRQLSSAHIIDVWDGSHDNRIDHCLFYEIYGIGIENKILGGSSPDLGNVDNVFDHLHFRNTPKSSQKEAIQVGRGSAAYAEEFATPTRVIIEWCLFEKADGDNELISIKSSNNIIRYNVVRDCNAVIKLRGGNENRVEGNWIEYSIPHQTHEVGVGVYGTGHIVLNNYIFGTIQGIQLYTGNSGTEPDVANVQVAHNTIVGVLANGIQIGHKEGVQPKNCVILNNIVQMNSLSGGPPKCFSEYPGVTDIFYGGNIAWPMNLKTIVGVESPGIKVVDPLLESVGTSWRLNPGSPAVGRGVVAPGVLDDIDGQSRDNAPDIGCDERSEIPATRAPVTARDVGPSWIVSGRLSAPGNLRIITLTPEGK
jgi:hypothetical protein